MNTLLVYDYKMHANLCLPVNIVSLPILVVHSIFLSIMHAKSGEHVTLVFITTSRL